MNIFPGNDEPTLPDGGPCTVHPYCNGDREGCRLDPLRHMDALVVPCTKRQPHPAHDICPGQKVPGDDPALAYTAFVTFKVEASGNQAQALDLIGEMQRFMKLNISKTAEVDRAVVHFHNEGVDTIRPIDPTTIPEKRM